MSEVMTEVLLFCKDVLGFAALALGLILTVRNVKKTSPSVAREQWQRDTDAKLDNDNRRINALERDGEKDRGRRADFERLMLRSMMEINTHLGMCKNNDNNAAMREVNGKIEEFLLNRYNH